MVTPVAGSINARRGLGEVQPKGNSESLNNGVPLPAQAPKGGAKAKLAGIPPRAGERAGLEPGSLKKSFSSSSPASAADAAVYAVGVNGHSKTPPVIGISLDAVAGSRPIAPPALPKFDSIDELKASLAQQDKELRSLEIELIAIAEGKPVNEIKNPHDIPHDSPERWIADRDFNKRLLAARQQSTQEPNERMDAATKMQLQEKSKALSKGNAEYARKIDAGQALDPEWHQSVKAFQTGYAALQTLMANDRERSDAMVKKLLNNIAKSSTGNSDPSKSDASPFQFEYRSAEHLQQINSAIAFLEQERSAAAPSEESKSGDALQGLNEASEGPGKPTSNAPAPGAAGKTPPGKNPHDFGREPDDISRWIHNPSIDLLAALQAQHWHKGFPPPGANKSDGSEAAPASAAETAPGHS